MVLSGGNTARDKNSTLTIASVEGVNAANGAAPTYAATKSDCVATVRDGRTHYVGSLCGCTAFDMVGDVAYVVCGEASRLTIVSLPTTEANAATTAMTVLGSMEFVRRASPLWTSPTWHLQPLLARAMFQS